MISISASETNLASLDFLMITNINQRERANILFDGAALQRWESHLMFDSGRPILNRFVVKLNKVRPTKMRKPNKRERQVLQDFAGTPEPWGRFAGAGQITLQSLLSEGWICPNSDPNYPFDYYQITPKGETAAYL